LYVARSRARLQHLVDMAGVPVLPVELCLGQLAEDLRLIDLVVAIDSALHRELCSLDDIIAAIRPRQRGLPVLRRALALCDGRSESAWETILRLLYMSPEIEVEPQHEIRNSQGEVVARGDLRIKGTNRLSEYDGAYHRDRAQHQDDLKREKMLSRLGMQRYGYIATEIVHEAGQIVRDAEDVCGLPHNHQRLGTWLTWVTESTLTWDGKRRLLRRLHRYTNPLRGRGARRRIARV